MRADYFTPEYLPETFKWIDANCLNFTNAHANSTWTLPSHLTMLTGLLPHEHEVELHQEPIPKHLRHKMIQNRLQSRGYKTAGFTGGVFVGDWFGFSNGFSRWYEPRDKKHSIKEDHLGSFIEAKRYMSSLSDKSLSKPNFLFIHSFYVHEHCRVPGGGREFSADRYGRRVRDFDSELISMINSILESPISDNLRMIITSDHGEGLRETHNLYNRELLSVEHGDWPCPSQVEIPLLIYDSENPLRGSSNKLVGLDDICATLETWAGMSKPKNDYLLSQDIEERDILVSEAMALTAQFRPRPHRSKDDWFARGVALISGDGEYTETFLEETKYTNDMPKKQELPKNIEEQLEALGYLH